MANQFTPGQVLDATVLNQLVNELNQSQADIVQANADIVIAKKGARQTVQNHYTSSAGYTPTAGYPGVQIGVLNTGITTQETNSKILYNLNMTYESHYDNALVLQRQVNGGGWTEIGQANNYGSLRRGFAVLNYDTDIASTATTLTKSFLDTPNVPAGSYIVYRVLVYGNATPIYINRTYNGASAGNYERASSQVILTEMVQ